MNIITIKNKLYIGVPFMDLYVGGKYRLYTWDSSLHYKEHSFWLVTRIIRNRSNIYLNATHPSEENRELVHISKEQFIQNMYQLIEVDINL